jgi:hypothetical protein
MQQHGKQQQQTTAIVGDVSAEQTALLPTLRPSRLVVLTITQFDGIPMADVFKVMQYWTFETSLSHAASCSVKVGLALHYIKSSMFKSQIFNGTKDELSELIKKWLVYVTHMATTHRKKALAAAASEQQVALAALRDDNSSEVVSGGAATETAVADGEVVVPSDDVDEQVDFAVTEVAPLVSEDRAATFSPASNTMPAAGTESSGLFLWLSKEWILLAVSVLVAALLLSILMRRRSNTPPIGDDVAAQQQQINRRIDELESLVLSNVRSTEALLQKHAELLQKILAAQGGGGRG